jgi:hypothetical protein
LDLVDFLLAASWEIPQTPSYPGSSLLYILTESEEGTMKPHTGVSAGRDLSMLISAGSRDLLPIWEVLLRYRVVRGTKVWLNEACKPKSRIQPETLEPSISTTNFTPL